MLVRVVRRLWARPVVEPVGISWSLPWWPMAAIGAIMAAVPMPKASSRVALEWAARTSSRETGRSSSLIFISRKSVRTEVAGYAGENCSGEGGSDGSAVDVEHDVHHAGFFDEAVVFAVEPHYVVIALGLGEFRGE